MKTIIQQTDDAKSELADKVTSLNLSSFNFDYVVKVLVVRWDGKIVPDLIGRSNVDRIAVLVSYGGTAKFLGATKIQSGTGKNIADAVYSVLVDWDIAEKVVGTCFDATSTNTGKDIGACIYSDNLLGRKLIQFACRHHTYEISLKNVFEKKHGKSNALETLLFNRFAKKWDDIKQNQINSGLNDPIIQSKISKAECEEIKQFCEKQLQHKQIRGDCKELLLLTVMFLGGDLYTCGATSHARFCQNVFTGSKFSCFATIFI